MDKLRFEFTLLPDGDGKSNVLSITSITTNDNKVYAIPEELQPARLHKQILETSGYSKVKNSLKKRYQVRRIWLTMSDELNKIYLDDDLNLQFGDQYLEEVPQNGFATTSYQAETSTLEKLLEKFVENTQPNKQQSLKNIAEKFVIDRFTTKSSNANQWIDIFEKECFRFEITADEKKIELLRLFMDKSCADWYSSMVIKFTLNSEWSTWKLKFCESFANKGWNPVSYALSFRYKEGSLLDYAIRKEKLLLDMRRTIDTGTLIDIIAAGLPEFILNKIDRETLRDTVDLFNEVSKYEHMVNKKPSLAMKRYVSLNINSKNEEIKACTICEKLNKGTRFHPEATCWFKENSNQNTRNYPEATYWFKTKDDKEVKKQFIKHVNNSVIEAELNETEPKN